MSQYFTHYWNQDTWVEEYAKPGHDRPFKNILGGQFFKLGVGPGHYLYAIGVHEQNLYLLSRIHVAQVVPNTGTDRRWPDKVIAQLAGSSNPHFNHLVPRDVAFALRFISPNGKDRLTPTAAGGIDAMALRMMRELTQSSAKLLDDQIEFFEEQLAHEYERIEALDEEVVQDRATPVLEGARVRVEVNRYERDPEVRLTAIQLHGTRCQVCHFSFEEIYGDLGKDYIEVHHLTPLSTHLGAHATDPRTDVAVLCANCHRMIHRRKGQALSLEQLRSLLQPMKASRKDPHTAT